MHDIIYQELIAGVVSEHSRQVYAGVIERLVARGEAIILGCTEIMLLVRPEDSTVPLFDTTALHARRRGRGAGVNQSAPCTSSAVISHSTTAWESHRKKMASPERASVSRR